MKCASEFLKEPVMCVVELEKLVLSEPFYSAGSNFFWRINATRNPANLNWNIRSRSRVDGGSA